ncbi:MAG: ABC transporter permease [Tannerella sp.]|jgi:putative ABC transport system permease protein|nr:ABC transporter permease [Tannerella sp.]
MIITTLIQNLRSLKRNKLFTALNLSGFVLGLTASMILALYIYREYNVDKCFPNHENIYLLINSEDNGVNIDYDLAGMLKEGFPEVEDAVTFECYPASQGSYLRNVSKNGFVTTFTTCTATNDFFRMFSVKTLIGSPQSPFTDDNSTVITASLAQKLFGRLDVVGEIIDVSGRNEFVISAVIEDFSENSSFAKADFFINNNKPENRLSMSNRDEKFWYPQMIYIQLAGTADPERFAANVNHSFPPVNDVESIRLVPLAETYMATELVGKLTQSGNPALAKVFLAITAAILILSVFNYINFSLSKQLATLKNIGIRITNGANPAQLRTMFVSEVAVMLVIAYLLALGLTYLALPFMQVNLLNVPLHFSNLFSPTLLWLSLAVLVAIVVIASLAPVYIIYRFDIQSLFGKGSMRLGKQRVKQVLTTVQLAASVILLVSLFTMYKQLEYTQSYSLGFDKAHLIKIALGRTGQPQAFKQTVDRFAFVENSALSRGAPGRVNMTGGFNVTDDAGEKLNLWAQIIFIDENFMKTMGIRLVDGREMLASDFGTSCYMNEEAIKQAGWKSYEGKRYESWGGYDIIGIVNDFSMLSIHSKLEPMALLTVKENEQRFDILSVRLKPSNLPEQMVELEKVWKQNYPNAPFSYAFYDDVFDAFYRKETQQARGIAAFSIIALLITCMGLIGQVFQALLVRRKEIGIRKVFGAGIMDIMVLFNMTFIKWFVAAFVVAVPIAYYFMNQWLQTFAYRTPLSWWVFALAGAATLAITLTVISWQCWRVASENPANTVRTE